MGCIICNKENVDFVRQCMLLKDKHVCFQCCFKISTGEVELVKKLREEYHLEKEDIFLRCLECMQTTDNLEEMAQTLRRKRDGLEPRTDGEVPVVPVQEIDKEAIGQTEEKLFEEQKQEETVKQEDEAAQVEPTPEEVREEAPEEVREEAPEEVREEAPEEIREEVPEETSVEQETEEVPEPSKEKEVPDGIQKLINSRKILKKIVSSSKSEQEILEKVEEFTKECVQDAQGERYGGVRILLHIAQDMIKQQNLEEVFRIVREASKTANNITKSTK